MFYKNERKAIMCTSCANQIKGEYMVLEKSGAEEYYHPQCAKNAGVVKLPVQIRFTKED
jgi:hypothetical protein